MICRTLLLVSLGLITCRADAAIVNVTVKGTVGFNVIQGNQTNVPDGAPVQMSFNVDSNNFVNSGSNPTRGYAVILSSFAMTVGGQPVPIVNPQPLGQTAYFGLRNNDPAVDGFFLSTNVDNFFPVAVNIPGLSQVHDLDFHATYGGSTLSSLNILDAVGTYKLSGLSVYAWTIGKFGNPGAEYNYQSLTIAVVPGPGTLTIGLLAGSLGNRRRRRQS